MQGTVVSVTPIITPSNIINIYLYSKYSEYEITREQDDSIVRL